MVSCFMIAIWALAICTFLVAAYAYGMQLKQVQLRTTPPTGPVGVPRRAAIQVGTLPDAAGTFFVISTRREGTAGRSLSAARSSALPPPR